MGRGLVRGIGGGVAAVGGVVAVAGVAFALAGSATRSGGPDVINASGVGIFGEASAAVQVVKAGEGSTHVTLHVTGAVADAGRTFGAHVHTKPCSELNTGSQNPHYAHHAVGAGETLQDVEVWLDFTVNPAGNAHAEAVRPWTLDESSPRSVVIHASPTAADGTAGARLACIDLDGDGG